MSSARLSGNRYINILRVVVAVAATIAAGPSLSAQSTEPLYAFSTLATGFAQPAGIAVDGLGNVYVADTNNHVIRRITPEGTITVVAGSVGASGSADGVESSARFKSPKSLAADSAGNVFVWDEGNYTIRKITPGGLVSTFIGVAGNGGIRDGIGAAAGVLYVRGLAVDDADNLYLSDFGTIRRSTPEGAITTLAGAAGAAGYVDGAGNAARFSSPAGLATDGAGNIFVADIGNDSIRKVTQSGEVSTFVQPVSVLTDPDAMDAPWALAIDSEHNLYVTTSANPSVRKISPGKEITILGGPTKGTGRADGIGSDAGFTFLQGIAVDLNGIIYLADLFDNSVRRGVKFIPTLSWAAPASIVYGTALSSQQLNATSDLAGNFTYSPSVGHVPNAGTQTLRVNFMPQGAVNYPGVAKQVSLVVNRATPVITWATPSAINFGTALSSTQLNATATVPGTFTYQPAASSVPNAGNRVLSVSFAPTDSANYTTANAQVVLAVEPITPVVSWSTPAAITYGTVLSNTELDASASVPGAFTYSPALGSFVHAGVQTLNVTFTPADNINYRTVTRSVSLSVNKVRLVITAVDRSKLEGEENPPFVFSYSGFVNGDTAASLDVPPTAITSATKSSPTGTYAIMPSAGLDNDYDIVVVLGTLTVSRQSIAPIITSATAVTFVEGRPSSFAVVATGNPPPSFNATGLPSWATLNSTTGLIEGTPTITGSPHTVTVHATNGVMPNAIQTLTLTVQQGTSAPSITGHPQDRTTNAGGNVGFSALATGAPFPGYAWQVSTDAGTTWSNLANTGQYSGVSTGSLAIVGVTISMNGYRYRCLAANSQGTATSQPAVLKVDAAVENPTRSSRLINISARGFCSAGDRVMIGGFVVQGSAPKRVLVRAVGPSLVRQGLSAAEVLADPVITVHHGAPVVASNDNWSEQIDAAEVAAVAAQTGASAFDSGDTKSSALVLSLQPGAYTFVATGKGSSSGIVLLEVYDADIGTGGSSFVNIATRAYATTGNGVTIGGFVIAGDSPKRVLLRAIGQTLTKQGIAQVDVLLDPVIALHDAKRNNVIVDTNDDWSEGTNAGSIVTTAARIGATPFDSADTRSSALLVTLDAGVYSFIASGKTASSGIVLVEVYDAD